MRPYIGARIYHTDIERFPFCDSPVMNGQHTLMVVLSPRLLLEVDLNVASRENEWHVKEGISPSKFREFRRRAIRNSFKEIVFSNCKELELWRNEAEFRSQVTKMSNPSERKTAIADAAAHVVLAVRGFDRAAVFN